MTNRTLTLLPDVGDFLRLSPHYNAATLVEIARFIGASHILWVTSRDEEHPARDAFAAAGLPITDLTPDWSWAEAEAQQVPDFLQQFPQGRDRLRAAAQVERRLHEALSVPMSVQRVMSPELLREVSDYHSGVTELLGDGPGNAHRSRRIAQLRALLAGREGLVFAALDDIPELLDMAALPDLTAFTPGEGSRVRALADRALRLEEDDDLDALVNALTRESGDAITPAAELRYAAANIYLAVGDLRSARDLLEAAAHDLRDHPRSLPGLVLARLGQVRDAQGERELAMRAYTAVLALSFAPQIALEVARVGTATPFQLNLDDADEP